MSVKMMDLRGQYLRMKDEIDEAIQSVLDGGQFIGGDPVKKFAEDFAVWNNVKHVIPCGNGTDALQIALMAMNCKPGDEIIVPSFTYIATVEVISLLGLVPRFVEVDIHTFNIDTADLTKVLTPRTKGVIPVHLYGQCAEMETVLAFARENGLFVIEDSAQAVGAVYSFADGRNMTSGTMGEVGCTSFFPTKNLGAYGDGGAMMTNSDEIAEKLRLTANHGQTRKYHHDFIGVNSRLDTLQAAVLSVKLKYLREYEGKRNEFADYYDKNLAEVSEIDTPFRSPNSTHVFHQYTIKVHDEKRDELKAVLSGKGVPTVVYYPIPQHLQRGYLDYGYRKGDLPVSESLAESVLSLPIHTELLREEQDHVISEIINFFR
jgi:dTDP-4-amino-4,6-dideoxygalactose transaminase